MVSERVGVFGCMRVHVPMGVREVGVCLVRSCVCPIVGVCEHVCCV